MAEVHAFLELAHLDAGVDAPVGLLEACLEDPEEALSHGASRGRLSTSREQDGGVREAVIPVAADDEQAVLHHAALDAVQLEALGFAEGFVQALEQRVDLDGSRDVGRVLEDDVWHGGEAICPHPSFKISG